MKKFIQKTGNSIHKRITRFWNKPVTTAEPLQTIGYGVTRHDPLVSIICINYNGEKHLSGFFNSLLSQTYKNYELIIVDNNSTDNSDQTILSYTTKFDHFTYVKAHKNLGFAEGNNHAFEHAQGEYIALINNDTRVDQEWLKELVTTLKTDGTCAAATSKTLFWDTFQDITMQSDCTIALNINSLKQSLEYDKYFIRTGRITGHRIISKNKTITLSLPSSSSAVHLELTANKPSPKVTLKIGAGTAFAIPCDCSLELSQYSLSGGKYIINNAGSSADAGMLPIDRGFGEYDTGQYNTPTSLPYFCGCSVLLRRAAILKRKLFVSELFAYYEDSELSRWLTNAGYSIIYNPNSIVYHKHASTSTEGSTLSKLLWKRNHAIFVAGNNLPLIKKSLTDISSAYRNLNNQELSKTLIEYDNALLQRLDTTEQIYEQSNAVGIFNSSWNLMGEREKHAVSLTAELQKKGTVYLIATSDFSIPELAHYCSTDLSPCRKLVISNFNSWHTGIFDNFFTVSDKQ